ncbi:MAG: hypothetical protein H6590_08185 [Flavobacteriales bacterium]|nr:hypothetical protein [Flavobacteriales bacterium]MCB9179381.1 hypothetical protein [Flavobacteriales bacterium]HPF91001.1 hypothetical protein [Flavobacteriales bacterium]
MDFGEEANAFIRSAHLQGLRMLLIGGGAVNFHGYQRQSPDLDFWMEPGEENFRRLALALEDIGYEVGEFPASVRNGEKNITLKMSPGLDVELITHLAPGSTFDEAWGRAEQVELKGEPTVLFRIFSFRDLIESKLRSGRPKDLLDVQELQRRHRS